jgi:ankyrin repeat protein
VNLLLALGADVNACDFSKTTPLHLAHDPAIVKLLITHKANLDAKDQWGTT